MANEEQLAILRQGVEVWNEWREKNIDVSINLFGANLGNANLIGAHLEKADLGGANLRGAILSHANLNGARLTSSRLDGAHLNHTNLIRTNITGAYLVGAYMSDATLIETRMNYAKLPLVDLRYAYLKGVFFFGADLSSSNLEGASISDADLRRADLHQANLGDTHLYEVNLGEAKLHETNLSKAQIGAIVFRRNDLSFVQGLETVTHLGPSTIGIDTLIKSGGKIPEVFLRGCGVPENFIEYLPSLIGTMQPIQFYSCFLSHSTKDHDFAQRLYDRLLGQRIRVWFAPEELKGGRLLDDQIDHAIRLHDKLILVLSDESIRSKWVMKEIRKARREELANNRRKLFPIRLTDMQTLENWECLDHETGHDLADVVRSYFIPDFSNWKDHNSFERAFTRFLDALKAADEPPVNGQDHEKRLQYLQRNLNLKQQAKAKFGLHVPTYIELEIEDLKQEITLLGGEITE